MRPQPLDVGSLANIPQEKGIDVVCRYYEDHYEQKLLFPSNDLGPTHATSHTYRKPYNEKHLVQTHGCYVYCLSYHIWSNMCFEVVCILHEVGIK